MTPTEFARSKVGRHLPIKSQMHADTVLSKLREQTSLKFGRLLGPGEQAGIYTVVDEKCPQGVHPTKASARGGMPAPRPGRGRRRPTPADLVYDARVAEIAARMSVAASSRNRLELRHLGNLLRQISSADINCTSIGL